MVDSNFYDSFKFFDASDSLPCDIS
jgi:hypothetical protein